MAPASSSRSRSPRVRPARARPPAPLRPPRAQPSFSALWVGQVISLFGDRVNQIALAAFVYEVTDSPLAVALTFFVGTVPNLLFSPDRRRLRGPLGPEAGPGRLGHPAGGAGAAGPGGGPDNVWLAYPLVFLITTISIFFRPAREAILPRIVPEEDLLAANSAMWVGETLADVINYPIAGLFVVFLQSSLAARVLVRCGDLPRLGGPAGDDRRAAAGPPGARAATRPRRRRRRRRGRRRRRPRPGRAIVDDLKAGWAFLRHETVLLANTLQGTAGQFSLGVLTVASLILAKEITPGTGRGVPRHVRVHGDGDRRSAAWSAASCSGAIAEPGPKGKMIIAAYTAFGLGAHGGGRRRTASRWCWGCSSGWASRTWRS